MKVADKVTLLKSLMRGTKLVSMTDARIPVDIMMVSMEMENDGLIKSEQCEEMPRYRTVSITTKGIKYVEDYKKGLIKE